MIFIALKITLTLLRRALASHVSTSESDSVQNSPRFFLLSKKDNKGYREPLTKVFLNSRVAKTISSKT